MQFMAASTAKFELKNFQSEFSMENEIFVQELDCLPSHKHLK